MDSIAILFYIIIQAYSQSLRIKANRCSAHLQITNAAKKLTMNTVKYVNMLNVFPSFSAIKTNKQNSHVPLKHKRFCELLLMSSLVWFSFISAIRKPHDANMNLGTRDTAANTQ